MSDTQKHTKPNVPNLRFPGFSGEWEESTFGDCCTGFDYGMNAASKQFDGKHKYIRITDIDENTSEYRGDGVVSPDTEIDEHYRVKENDILFARTGASTGKTYLYDPKDGRLYYAGFLIRMNVSPRNDSRFVFYQTQTPRYKKWVQIMSMRSGQPGINSQEYSSYRCFLPKLEEQQKIAKLLTIIDQRISIQNKVIEDLKKLKTALEERLLDQCIGEQVRLGDILTERVEKSRINNQYEVLSSTISGIYSQREYFNKEIASADNTGYKVIHRDDVVLSPQNLWMGNINFNDCFEIGIVSPSYKVFSINAKYDKRYIAFLLKSKKALWEYSLVSEQGASIVRRNLNIESFLEIAFHIPTRRQQIESGDMITSVFDKIRIEQRYLKILFRQKHFLLNNLII